MGRIQTLILVLVVVGGSGCLASNPSNTTQEPTSQVLDTTVSVDFPAEPAEVSSESAIQYVKEYERAHRKQAVYDKHATDDTAVTQLMVSMYNESVDKRGEQEFLVTLQYTTGYTTERGDSRVAHDDRYIAKYYINSSTTLRTATVGVNGTDLHPLQNGTVVSGNT